MTQTTLASKPPIANKIPISTSIHNTTLIDDYAWLRGKEKSEVIEYLNAENTYTQSVMSDTEQVQLELYKELRGRIKETDQTTLDKMGEYFYYSRTEEGKQYSIYCRKFGTEDANEEIILDVNLLAEGHPFFTLGTLKVSPDHSLLGFTYDIDGSERFTVAIKDLANNTILTDKLANTSGSIVWLNDNKTFLYNLLDETFRSFKAYKHILGTEQVNDELLLHEKDESFSIAIDKSKDDQTILVGVHSSTTSEYYFADANSTCKSLTMFATRVHEIEYHLDAADEIFYIQTNEEAKNFRLMTTPFSNYSRTNWNEIIPHRPETKLQSFEIFEKFIVAKESTAGLEQFRIQNIKTNDVRYIHFSETAYSIAHGRNFIAESSTFRFSFSSPVTPITVIDYNFVTGEQTMVKQSEIPNYNPENYVVERVYALANDGTQIPITVIFKKGIELDSTNLLYLYGYGSYGISMPDSFSSKIITLLNKGFIYAVAHVRGGSEMGEQWHDSGKMLLKKNTFTDFICSAEYLIEKKYTSAKKIAIEGRSAGGLLVGAVTNMRPDLFNVVIAGVPFVDMMNTMLDSTLPLTIGEYEEWGNPNEKQYFDYMLSYSPYDNVTAKSYPHILALAGISDPRVSYWEPAKWVAKLRKLKTDDNIILLKTNMDSGHFGASGRFDYLKEIAFQYAFVLKIFGLL
ncbi:MAG: S9 family peptidase [Bacteroidetes bacterium]|nr:S9 family peptidase [Bacteroidota bacterium]